jgi:Rrf2 family protein
VNLSKRGEYAIRVLLDLAMAKSQGRVLVPLGALAEAQRIPVAFLDQILLSLRQAGFLSSTRGKYGGYALAKAPSEIVLGELVRFLEGPLVGTGCVTPNEAHKCSCPDQKHCGLRLLMTQVREALSGVLDGMTLADLAGRTLGGFQADGLLPAVLQQKEPAAASAKRRKPGGELGSEPEYLI